MSSRSRSDTHRRAAGWPGTRLVAAVAILVAAATACEREPRPIEPPEIAYGEDVCDRCGMIISEDRYAAGMMVEDEDGRAYRLFDDVAAVALYEGEHPDVRVIGRWVKDYVTRQWLTADSAAYVEAGSLETPMAFGVVATARARADSLAGALDGRVLDWGELVARADTGGIRSTPGRPGGSP